MLVADYLSGLPSPGKVGGGGERERGGKSGRRRKIERRRERSVSKFLQQMSVSLLILDLFILTSWSYIQCVLLTVK